MDAAKQVIWFFFTLLILAGSGWYYNHNAVIERLDNETLMNSVDATVSQLRVRQFNKEGVLINHLTTPLMEHIPKDDVYLLQTPQISMTQDDQTPWNISANKATSYKGWEQITFTGDVIVHQQANKNTAESTLKTEAVTYFPKQKKASTDLHVTYEQAGNVIQSQGMNAYLDEKRVELLHKARGSYVPENG